MKATYSQLNSSNTIGDRTYLPNYYHRIVKYRNDNERMRNRIGLKSINPQDYQHRMKMYKESSRRNEVLQSDSEEDASAAGTTKPIDQLAVETTSKQFSISRIEGNTKKPNVADVISTESSRDISSTTADSITITDTNVDTTTNISSNKPPLDVNNNQTKDMSSTESTVSVVTMNKSTNISRRGSIRKSTAVLSKAVWGRWQPWTDCSRHCGGGVMSQSRPCLSR